MTDEVTVKSNKDLKIDVLDNDDLGNSPFDEDSLVIVTDPHHAKDFQVDKDELRYRSEKDFEGIDIIEYKICNTNGLCHIGTVIITVTD